MLALAGGPCIIAAGAALLANCAKTREKKAAHHHSSKRHGSKSQRTAKSLKDKSQRHHKSKREGDLSKKSGRSKKSGSSHRSTRTAKSAKSRRGKKEGSSKRSKKSKSKSEGSKRSKSSKRSKRSKRAKKQSECGDVAAAAASGSVSKQEGADFAKIGAACPTQVKTVAVNVSPAELSWSAQGGLRDLRIVNNSSEYRAVKAKCTDNLIYRVHPVYSIVAPGEAVRVDVLRNNAASKGDTLFFQTTKADNGAETDAKALFASKPDSLETLVVPLTPERVAD